MSILCVGSVALDSVETPFGKREEILGGSGTHFSVAASFFTDVNLVAVVGDDFPEEHLEFLRQRQVDLAGLERVQGRTFRWRGRYDFDLNNAQTLETELNVFAEFRPKIPLDWQRPEYLFLANIHPDLQLKVLESVERPRLVALDTMNFWIEGEPLALRRIIEKVDLLIINEAECRELAGEPSLLKAARKLLSWGPDMLIAKQGEYGAMLFHGNEIFSVPGFPLDAVADPTGAGDSFAGGVMGFLSQRSDPSFEDMKRAVVMGSVMASFNVEDFSCDRLRQLPVQEIKQRYEAFRRLSHFEVQDAQLLAR